MLALDLLSCSIFLKEISCESKIELLTVSLLGLRFPNFQLWWSLGGYAAKQKQKQQEQQKQLVDVFVIWGRQMHQHMGDFSSTH